MSVIARSMARSLAAAAITAAVLVAANWVDFAAFCRGHRAFVRRQDGRSDVIRADGYMVARPSDSIYACTVQHCFAGALDCHADLGCYCAPATLGADRLGTLIGGACSVDQPHPSRDDDHGGCRRARCDEQIPP